MAQKKQFILIIDGSSLLATSYYSTLPKAIRKEKDEKKLALLYENLLPKDPQGRYINGVEKFFNTINTIETYQKPTHLAICWDSGRNTFRKDLWSKYKSNRSETPPPLKEQFKTAIELCDKLGLRQVMDSRYEADDFAGSIARAMERHMDVRILTRDKDYFQLISDKTRIWYGMADLMKVKEIRRKYSITDMPSRVIEVNKDILIKEFGYSPESVPMIKALFGDASDNIPGVSGMGENRSISLAQHYHTVEALYKDIDRSVSRKAREQLRKKWKSWGIHRNPYSVLIRPAQNNRPGARQMADLCYTLGKIKTDIDLFDYLPRKKLTEVFRFRFQLDEIDKVLKAYNIHALPKRKARKSKTERKVSIQSNSNKRNESKPKSAGKKGQVSKKAYPAKKSSKMASQAKFVAKDKKLSALPQKQVSSAMKNERKKPVQGAKRYSKPNGQKNLKNKNQSQTSLTEKRVSNNRSQNKNQFQKKKFNPRQRMNSSMKQQEKKLTQNVVRSRKPKVKVSKPKKEASALSQ